MFVLFHSHNTFQRHNPVFFTYNYAAFVCAFIAERWIDSVVDVVRVNEWIMYVKLLIRKQIVHCSISAYAPKVDLSAEEIQNPFLTAQSTQIKSVISVPIKDFIHHYPRALFNDIPGRGAV